MAMLEFWLRKGDPGGENPLWDLRQNAPPKIRKNISTHGGCSPRPGVHVHPIGFLTRVFVAKIPTKTTKAKISGFLDGDRRRKKSRT